MLLLTLSACLFSGKPYDAKLSELAAEAQCADGTNAQRGLLDRDRDGFGSGEPTLLCTEERATSGVIDCDDDRADVFPGAPERCDGIDEDCRGDGDEAAYIDLFEDLDGDGFGGIAIRACPGPALVANGLDCDDHAFAVHPDAIETCDGVDQDCDGVADDGLPTTPHYLDADGDGLGDGAPFPSCGAFGDRVDNQNDCDDADPTTGGFVHHFADLDADGFGDPNTAEFSCPSALSVFNGDDCDDADMNIHPGAVDYGGGEDSDCDSDSVECGSPYASPNAELQPEIDAYEAACGAPIDLRLTRANGPYAPFSMSLAGTVTCEGATEDPTSFCTVDSDLGSEERLMSLPMGGALRGIHFLARRAVERDGGCLQSGGPLDLEDVRFQDCTGQGGGALHLVSGASQATLTRVTFLGSTGSYGGAIRVGNDVDLIATNLSVQQSSSDRGAVYLDPGSTATLFDPVFEDNLALTSGGAIASVSAAITIQGGLFLENSAAEGGGIWAVQSDIELTEV